MNIQSPGSTVVNSSVSTLANAAENTSISSTVPMQETGTPFTGLIVGVLSILGGLGISRKGRRKKLPILLIIGVVFAMALCGTASADELPLTTNQSDTVSGDLYVNATQPTPFNQQQQDVGVTQEATYNFAPSGYTNITYAKLYTVVYVAGTDSRACGVNVTFDGNNDGTYETVLENNTILNIASELNSGNVFWLNDHINRVYSDYYLSYDVLPYITNGVVKVKVQTAPSGSGVDGRIKFLALIVAYNDGDGDRISYWVE